MATAKQQTGLKKLFEQVAPAGGIDGFREVWEQSLGVVTTEFGNGNDRRQVKEYDASKREFNPGCKQEFGDWAVGEIMYSMLGPRWKQTFEQFWRPACGLRNLRMEGVGGQTMSGDTPYVSAALDVVAGLLNARTLARSKHPEWIWNKMCTVQEATGEGGFHIGKRVRPGTQIINDLADGQMLSTTKMTSTRIHRNRSLRQGVRTEVNYWDIHDDLTQQIMEAVDEISVFPLAERERKVADGIMGIASSATLSSGLQIGTIGQALPMIQDGLPWFPWQKGTYNANANATTAAPENQLAIANYGNCNDGDTFGLQDYTAFVRAMQVLNANRDPFTLLPPSVGWEGMQFLVAPAARVQLEFLLQSKALWQIAWGAPPSGTSSSVGSINVSDYNLIEKFKLQVMESQFWFNRMVDAGVYKVSATGVATQQTLTNNASDTYNTPSSIMSAFYMGHFRDAAEYWQRMPYQTVSVPLDATAYGEQTVLIQDHHERGQLFWKNPRAKFGAHLGLVRPHSIQPFLGVSIMKRRKLWAIFGIYAGLVLIIGIGMGASIGPWPIAGNLPTSQQGYTISSGTSGPNSGHFAFSSTAAGQTYCVATGSSASFTSTPANWVILQLAGSGVLTTGGTNGVSFATTQITAGTLATNATASTSFVTYQLNPGNLNSLFVTGTGQVGYVYGN